MGVASNVAMSFLVFQFAISRAQMQAYSMQIDVSYNCQDNLSFELHPVFTNLPSELLQQLRHIVDPEATSLQSGKVVGGVCGVVLVWASG